MALIPYEHLPPPHDPAIAIAGQPLQEYYCGDARCDCATAHVLLGGIHMTVDLGTTHVELADNRQATPAHAALTNTVRATLREGAISTLRAHYATVREFGREQHFRYMDWSAVKAGEFVAWEQVFRHESTPMWKMTPTEPAAGETSKDAAKTEGEPAQGFLFGIADSYCIEPKCDCQRVIWSAVSAPAGQPNRAQGLGTVEFSFVTGQPAVGRHAPNVNPNQLFMLIHNLLRAQPQLPGIFQQRYTLLREHLTPILAAQRRQRSEAHRQASFGRNDPCPCGSGKKYKKCHGS
jgi:hypothetical protein